MHGHSHGGVPCDGNHDHSHGRRSGDAVEYDANGRRKKRKKKKKSRSDRDRGGSSSREHDRRSNRRHRDEKRGRSGDGRGARSSSRENKRRKERKARLTRLTAEHRRRALHVPWRCYRNGHGPRHNIQHLPHFQFMDVPPWSTSPALRFLLLLPQWVLITACSLSSGSLRHSAPGFTCSHTQSLTGMMSLKI